jgi:hypothetical protein
LFQHGSPDFFLSLPASPRGVRFLTFIPDIVESSLLASTFAAGSELESHPTNNLLVRQIITSMEVHVVF